MERIFKRIISVCLLMLFGTVFLCLGIVLTVLNLSAGTPLNPWLVTIYIGSIIVGTVLIVLAIYLAILKNIN